MRTALILRAIVSLLLAALDGHGQGSFLYDQQSASGPAGPAILNDIQPNEPIGQSFAPALSGVGFVQFELFDGLPRNGVGATVYVNVLSDSINNGTVLGSTAGVFMPDNFQGVTNFFFPTTVQVTPGTTYYFQLEVASGDTWLVNNGFSYGNGVSLLQGAPQFGLGSLWFREGVLVPEPQPGLLTLAGCLIAYARFKNASDARRSNSKKTTSAGPGQPH